MIIVKITLKFFSKFCWGHVNCTLATCRIFLPKYGNFRSETENDQTISLLSKKTSKPSAAPVGCSFEKVFKKFTPKVQLVRSTTKKLEQSFFIRKKRPENVPLNTLNVVLTILRVSFVWLFKFFCSKSQKWFEKKKIFHDSFGPNFFLF